MERERRWGGGGGGGKMGATSATALSQVTNVK